MSNGTITAISLTPTAAYVNSALQCNVTAQDNVSSSMNVTYTWNRAIGQNNTYLVAGSSGGYIEGVGSAAKFMGPRAVDFGADGWLYVADTSSNRIRKINTTTNQTYLVAGNSTTTYGEGVGKRLGVLLSQRRLLRL